MSKTYFTLKIAFIMRLLEKQNNLFILNLNSLEFHAESRELIIILTDGMGITWDEVGKLVEKVTTLVFSTPIRELIPDDEQKLWNSLLTWINLEENNNLPEEFYPRKITIDWID